MQIECATTSAAAEVLLVLMHAELRAGRAFHMEGPRLPKPPTYFTIHVDLPTPVVRLLQAIPDTIIIGT